MGARDFWHKLARRSQSNLYFALGFLPAVRREAFRDVYRFLRAADDVADDPSLSPVEARARLDEWRRELDAVYAGGARHPFAVRLAASVARYGLARDHFDTIVDALAEDVEPRRFATQRELEAWCERVSSTLGYLCLDILEVPGAGPRSYARDLGIALQLANNLRDVGADATRGHVYLPHDAMTAAGLDPEALAAGPAFSVVARGQAERIRELVKRARAHVTEAELRGLLVPEIWADVYLSMIDELASRDFDVFTARPNLRKRRKLAIAFGRWVRQRARALLPRPSGARRDLFIKR